MSDGPGLSAVRSFLEAAACWREMVGEATDVVDAAVRVVIEHDAPGESIVAVAALSQANASQELSSVLDEALDELGYGLLRHGHPENQLLAGATLAHRYLRGQIELKQLTSLVHDRFGHESHALLAGLADIDDMLDTIDYFQNPTPEQLHARGHALAIDVLEASDAIVETAIC